jgi:hypothetical protein
MIRGRPKTLAVAACLWIVAAWVVAAPPAKKPKAEKDEPRFVRLVRDNAMTPIALETAIVRCESSDKEPDAPTVDLVAAIHIADKSYYERLNREFKKYDAVLYELVAPEDARPLPTDKPSNHPISLLQNGLKDILALEFQLKHVDYTAKNMVHADMSPDEFAESMKKRGETMLSMLARMMGYAMAREGATGGNEAELLMALFQKDRALALKRALAEQFEISEGSMIALEGPAGSTLVSGRNQKAIDVLREQIDAGKRKIAIFYGAAHMFDFEIRLAEQFKMKPVETRWVEAWNLKSPADKPAGKKRR